MNIINFTNKEMRALKELVWSSNICENGCVYNEMERAKKGCNECEFEKSRHSILKKLSL